MRKIQIDKQEHSPPYPSITMSQSDCVHRRMVRHTIAAYLVLTLLGLAGCGYVRVASESTGAAQPTLPSQRTVRPSPTPQLVHAQTPEVAVAAAGPQVTIDNFAFSPALLTVTVGTTVTWINHDDMVHTVTAADRNFHSDALDTDDQFSYQFTTTGVYTYFCSIHPHMIAHVVVR